VLDVPADGTLIDEVDVGQFYLLWAGVRHRLADSATMDALGLHASHARSLAHTAMGAIPDGSTLRLRRIQGLVYPLAPIDAGSANLWLSVPAAVRGTTVMIRGSGFGAGEPVRVSFAGTAIEARCDGRGEFDAAVSLPAGQAAGAILPIYASGTTTGAFAVQPLGVLGAPGNAAIVLSVPAAAPGGHISVRGSGFAAGEQVDLFLAAGASVATASANGGGALSATMAVPSTLIAGPTTLIAYGTNSRLFAAAPMTVAAPDAPAGAMIRLSRSAASPGSQLLVSGSGFTPGELVSIRLAGSRVVSVTANRQGAFADVSITIPAVTLAVTLTVTATGAVSGRVATSTLTVAASGAHSSTSSFR
jgi:hypothetical protein